MADRGFDIMEDLAPHGVKLNIPPVFRGKSQLDQRKLIETRRIASLREMHGKNKELSNF